MAVYVSALTILGALLLTLATLDLNLLAQLTDNVSLVEIGMDHTLHVYVSFDNCYHAVDIIHFIYTKEKCI